MKKQWEAAGSCLPLAKLRRGVILCMHLLDGDNTLSRRNSGQLRVATDSLSVVLFAHKRGNVPVRMG